MVVPVKGERERQEEWREGGNGRAEVMEPARASKRLDVGGGWGGSPHLCFS